MGTRQVGGLKAKKIGDTFEQIFKVACKIKGVGVVRIPNGCTRVRSGASLRLIPCRTPFDYVIAKDGFAAALDCKTIDQSTFSKSNVVPEQVESLAEIGQHIPSGYVIWFRPLDLVCFFPWQTLHSLSKGQGLKPADGVELGQIDNIEVERILANGTTKRNYQSQLF